MLLSEKGALLMWILNIAILLIAVIVMIVFMYKLTKKTMDNDYHKHVELLRTNRLTFGEILEVLEFIIDDVWTKQEFYYNIKEISVIPDMQNDIAQLTNGVINAISPQLLEQSARFIEREYLWKYITRQMQIRVIKYQNSVKPSSK